jgi:hypothetical protein
MAFCVISAGFWDRLRDIGQFRGGLCVTKARNRLFLRAEESKGLGFA